MCNDGKRQTRTVPFPASPVQITMSATDKDPLVLSCVAEEKNYLADFQVTENSSYSPQGAV